MQPDTRLKVFEHHAVGEVRLTVTAFAAATAPECRLFAYTPAGTPAGDGSRSAIRWSASHPDTVACDHTV